MKSEVRVGGRRHHTATLIDTYSTRTIDAQSSAMRSVAKNMPTKRATTDHRIMD